MKNRTQLIKYQTCNNTQTHKIITNMNKHNKQKQGTPNIK